MLSVAHNELLKHLEKEAFYSHVLDLKVGDKATKVVLKDMQRHPSKPFILHVDFMRVSQDEKLKMVVPLHFLNEDSCKGAKAGGLVSHNITEIEIVCLPKDLPEFITLDLAELEIGSVIHLSELVMPEGVALSHAPESDEPVVAVHGPRGGEGEEAEGEESAS